MRWLESNVLICVLHSFGKAKEKENVFMIKEHTIRAINVMLRGKEIHKCVSGRFLYYFFALVLYWLLRL